MPVKKMTDLDLTGKRVLIREDLNVPVKTAKSAPMPVFWLLYPPSNWRWKKARRSWCARTWDAYRR